MPTFKLKRIYETPDKADGYRVLVDRLWPRGVKKENAQLNEWLKNLAPSTELRKRYHQGLENWDDFKREYDLEIESNKDINSIIKRLKEENVVTLLYAAHNKEHNNAKALKEYLEAHF
ncbi:DUF488 family protein [Olivibacter sp. CPCC 100613]|uniref:DUF488 domain-containing protein n=1 Tax=Olivibacter sp. CPCC 100613 TaxID=3079931 RepID=UPI002FF5F1BC